MNREVIERRIQDLERMIKIYEIIFRDPSSHLYKDELIKSFLKAHLDELFCLKMKIIYNKEVTI